MLDQIVLVNGAQRDDITCVATHDATGPGGRAADFLMPAALFDTSRDDLRDALVVVYVLNAYNSAQPAEPDFVGFLDADSATLSDSEDGVTIRANSITAYLHRVFVGQMTGQPVVRYNLVDPQTGLATGWTPKRVLQDLFDHHLPSYYGARVRLGNLNALESSIRDACPEFTFRMASFTAAIDQILGIFGDVTFSERPDGSGYVYLDFWKIQDPAAPVSTVTVAAWNDPVVANANVGSISNSQTIADAVTRVIVYCSQRRYILTVSSNDPDPLKRLQKGWDTSLEAAVLADPKRARPAAPGYQPGMEFVFRRWLLPAVLRQFNILKSLPIHRAVEADGAPGPEICAQAYKFPTLLTANGTTGDWTGAVQTTPGLIKSVKWELDKYVLELGSAEDGLNITAITVDEATGKPVQTWAAATVCATVAVEDTRCMMYDSGQDHASGIQLPFGVDGLTEVIQREDLEWVQVTNTGYAFTTAAGTTVTFAATRYYDEDAKGWVYVTSPVRLRDDSRIAEQMARDILKTRCRRHQAPQISLEFFSRAYRPGNRLQIVGLREDIPGPLMITSVSHDLLANTTAIQADNVKPPIRRDLTKYGRSAILRPMPPPVARQTTGQRTAPVGGPTPYERMANDLTNSKTMDSPEYLTALGRQRFEDEVNPGREAQRQAMTADREQRRQAAASAKAEQEAQAASRAREEASMTPHDKMARDLTNSKNMDSNEYLTALGRQRMKGVL